MIIVFCQKKMKINSIKVVKSFCSPMKSKNLWFFQDAVLNQSSKTTTIGLSSQGPVQNAAPSRWTTLYTIRTTLNNKTNSITWWTKKSKEWWLKLACIIRMSNSLWILPRILVRKSQQLLFQNENIIPSRVQEVALLWWVSQKFLSNLFRSKNLA